MRKPKQSKEERDFFTLQEVADKLRVHPRTILRYIENNRLQAVRAGYWRIPKESYERFLRENSNFQTEVAKFRRKKK
jgi:excisionase family DNA binding protein